MQKRGSMAMGEEDRLSRLPDDLLHSILSELPLKHAVRTSVLSRRWAPQWLRALASSRVLDLADPDSASCQLPARAAATVRRCVELHAAYGAPLDVLRVALITFPPEATSTSSDDDGAFGRDVVGWIASAVARGAREVEVDLTPMPTPTPALMCQVDIGAPFVEMPGDMFVSSNSLERLALGGFSLPAVVPGGAAATGLAGLRSLSLSYVDLTGSAVGDVVSSCRALEHLSLISSGSFRSSPAIRIASETLRVLEILRCTAMEELRVTAPALESIALHNDMFNWDSDVGDVFSFDGDMPALRDVYLSHLDFGHDSSEYDYNSLLSAVEHAPVWTLSSDGYNLMFRFDTTNIQELQLLITDYGDPDHDERLESFAGFFQDNRLPFLDRLFVHFPSHVTDAIDADDAAAELAGEVVDDADAAEALAGEVDDDADAAAALAGEVDDDADAAAALAGEVVDDSGLEISNEFVLDSLSFIKLVNFRGRRFDLQLLDFVLKWAPAIEQLVLVTAGEEGDEHQEVIRRKASAMLKASPHAHLTVCRPSQDRSQNPVHTMLYDDGLFSKCCCVRLLRLCLK